jgi:hypothetical protein
MPDIKREYKECRLRLTFHALNVGIKRNFPLTKLRDMVLRGKWLTHIEEEKTTCVCKNGSNYWSLILAPHICRIFIITIFPSNYGR